MREIIDSIKHEMGEIEIPIKSIIVIAAMLVAIIAFPNLINKLFSSEDGIIHNYQQKYYTYNDENRNYEIAFPETITEYKEDGLDNNQGFLKLLIRDFFVLLIIYGAVISCGICAIFVLHYLIYFILVVISSIVKCLRNNS